MSADDPRPPFERVGGEAVIFAVLDDLYTRLFADLMVGFLFAGHDKAAIVRAQTVFTRRMLGDRAARYEGKSIPDAHANVPILPGHFDRRHHLLAQTLVAHGVDPAARTTWLALDEGLRTSVLRVGRSYAEALNREPPDDER